jgi:ABC-type phosphate transport system substrate-binding protein
MKRALLFLVLCLSTPLRAETSAPAKIYFIVRSDSPISKLSAQEIADYFLKRRREWPHGKSVRFFDRRDDNPERNVFLKRVLKKSLREVELYWIGRMQFTGDSAPAQIASDAMVANMVARFDGAIGYVSSDFKGAKNIKVIEVEGLSP